ncbi:META domain-containing protein [Altererythrobacter confluentis]|uniref:META domain-containing protein n=1 Tax=Allopontixanthobacter confluentis TaxID=1849021 RepID=A0A6L7GK70_9SPHN|nr:META domain-containing protein [Allopontixanthobacter confluentis]MXP15704.1 META domain-containing protein [Allopontixanthobacter confluentis]
MNYTVLLFVVGLLACNLPSAEKTSDTSADSSAQTVPAMAEIEGHWLIEAIDGETLPAANPAPYLVISRDAAGGSIGCNAFGGTALYADGRIAVHSWGGDAMRCPGRMDEWEAAIAELFHANPHTRLSGETLRLRSRDHVIELARMDKQIEQIRSPAPMRIPVAEPPDQALANTRWVIRAINGETASASPTDRHLRFGQDTWQGLASCATLFGTYAIDDRRIIVGNEISSTEQLCPAEYVVLDDALADLMRSDPHYLVGPNGELIIAGGGHVLTGEQSR